MQTYKHYLAHIFSDLEYQHEEGAKIRPQEKVSEDGANCSDLPNLFIVESIS
jgi:hypothetical protein